jgi:hypothetical protein
VVRPAPLDEQPVTAEALRAFLVGDATALRAIFGLEVWQDTPLVSAACVAAGHGGAWGACRCAVLALRARIIADVERLGAFTWSELDAEAEDAWAGLVRAARAVGLRENTEPEGNDGGT